MEGRKTGACREAVIAGQLAQYRSYAAMLALTERPLRASERVLLTMRLRDIERAVRALPVGRERLFLELHYFEGHTVERCAELMQISRATAFRIRRRGIAAIAANERLRDLHA